MNTISDHYTTLRQEFSTFGTARPMLRREAPLGYVQPKVISDEASATELVLFGQRVDNPRVLPPQKRRSRGSPLFSVTIDPKTGDPVYTPLDK